MYEDSFSYQDAPASLVERGVYAGAIERLARLRFGCDRVTVILSERFMAEPEPTLRWLWGALGLPYVAKVTSPGKAPMTQNRPRLPMLNSTQARRPRRAPWVGVGAS